MERSENPYRIDYAGQYRRQLEDLIKQAAHLGTLADLEDAVKRIHKRLSTAPLEWGDPLYRLRYLDLLLISRNTHAAKCHLRSG
jgi:hypothetical protein